MQDNVEVQVVQAGQLFDGMSLAPGTYDVQVIVGDEVLIWGDTENGQIQVLDVAEAMGSIPYEMTCGVSRRVQRVVMSDGGDSATD